MRLGWVERQLLLPFAQLQERVADQLTGVQTDAVYVDASCSGGDAMALCLGAVLAFPATWSARLRGRCRPVGGDRGAGPHRCACRRRHDCGRSDPVVDGDLSSVTADAAYDTIAVYEAAGARVENVFFRYTSIIGRWPSRAECSRAGGSGGPRVSRAESDEGRGQACVVRDQGVTNSWVGIVAGHGRFMQQGRAGWRTRSSATRPALAMAFAPGVQRGRGVRSSSAVRSSIG